MAGGGRVAQGISLSPHLSSVGVWLRGSEHLACMARSRPIAYENIDMAEETTHEYVILESKLRVPPYENVPETGDEEFTWAKRKGCWNCINDFEF